jgi:hypothetical protein
MRCNEIESNYENLPLIFVYFFDNARATQTIAMIATKINETMRIVTRLSQPPALDLEFSDTCDELLLRPRDSLKAF